MHSNINKLRLAGEIYNLITLGSGPLGKFPIVVIRENERRARRDRLYGAIDNKAARVRE